MMLSFHLNESLDSIAGGGNMEQIVFELKKWAQSRNKLKQLIQAALEENPGNIELQRISKEMNY